MTFVNHSELDEDYDPYDCDPCPHGFKGFCPGCEARSNPRYGYRETHYGLPGGTFNAEGDYFEQNCCVHQGHTNPSWYNDLGIDPPTSLSKIRKAYHKKALLHHPDKGGDEQDFKRINEAYVELSAIYN